MRVGKDLRYPGMGLFDPDTEFLLNLAYEGLARGLAGLDLASGKFPVACIDLAGRPPRKQYRTVGPLEDGYRHLDRTARVDL